MTAREMGFIKAAARGLRLAAQQLADNPEEWVAAAMNVMQEDDFGAISNHDIAYFAAMYNAWEDMGKPDLLT